MPATKLESARQSLLQARARGMRHAPTASEALLWESIRASKLGVAFRRQVPLGRYIVDFYAPKIRLAVEVDGKYHAKRAKADARRDDALRRLGCTVLRLDAELVMHDPPAALARISSALQATTACE